MPSITGTDIPLADVRAEIAAVIVQRRKVYAKWIAAGTMTKAEADMHQARLEAAIQIVDNASAREGNRP